MGIFSTIGGLLWSGICAIGSAIKTGFHAVKNFLGNAVGAIGSALSAGAGIVAALPVPAPVKTVATVAAIALPVITIGYEAVKAFKNKKKSEEADNLMEKLVASDTSIDEDSDVDSEALELRDEVADEMRLGKKKAKSRKKTYRLLKKSSSESDEKASSKKGSVIDEVSYDRFETIDDILEADVSEIEDEDDDIQGQLYRAPKQESLSALLANC